MTTDSHALVADIGGTHCRFALVSSRGLESQTVAVLRCADFAGVGPAVADYLRRQAPVTIERGCFAVAAVVDGASRVRLTNNPWQFDREEIRRHFGWSDLQVVNDFTAMALGTTRVAAGERVPLCGGPGEPSRPRLVMGPGTGLGMAALVPVGDGWLPLATEGGHVDFAPVDATEMAILEVLQERFGRVSVERILCGPGLLNLYQALGRVRGLATPLDQPRRITAAALASGDALAEEALGRFSEILGRVAGNAVLTLGSLGGVCLCGGMLPSLTGYLRGSGFQRGFEDKGRMRPLLQATPVQVVTDPCTGLLGAAEVLRTSA